MEIHTHHELTTRDWNLLEDINRRLNLLEKVIFTFNYYFIKIF